MGISPLDGLSGIRPIAGQGSGGRRHAPRERSGQGAAEEPHEVEHDEVTLSAAAQALAAAMEAEEPVAPALPPTVAEDDSSTKHALLDKPIVA